ncbi:MAG: DUF1254 domain-containing protein [Verrucomicrobiota bacterium]
MKPTTRQSLTTAFLLGAVLAAPTFAQEKSAPAFTAEQLIERTIQRCAVEAVIWGMPVVNYDTMFQAMVRDTKAGPGSNKIVYWSRPFGWRNQTLTPNPDTIYLMPFINTKDSGPMVLEIPPAGEGTIVGSVDDCWQAAIEDVGPAGVDKGKGGRYLILPPGYQEKVPGGYIAMPSDTWQTYALLRSNIKGQSDAEIAAAVAYGKQIKLYPLAQAAHPPDTTFIDALDVVFDANIPYDLRFFESLNRMVQSEPWIRRDMAMIEQLKSIGIVQGKPFQPDAKTREILLSAITEARAWIDLQYEALYTLTAEYPGSHWALPASKELIKATESHFAETHVYPTDGRGVAYSYAFFGPKHLGAGQYYLFTIRDKDGNSFDGRSTYRLRVPPDVPVKQYWSVTAYDRVTHGLIRDTQWSSRSSHTPGLMKNADGSVDLYFAAQPPEGKESNWIPTSAAGKFEALFRFYGPEKAIFEKTWKLPDIEKVN